MLSLIFILLELLHLNIIIIVVAVIIIIIDIIIDIVVVIVVIRIRRDLISQACFKTRGERVVQVDVLDRWLRNSWSETLCGAKFPALILLPSKPFRSASLVSISLSLFFCLKSYYEVRELTPGLRSVHARACSNLVGGRVQLRGPRERWIHELRARKLRVVNYRRRGIGSI